MTSESVQTKEAARPSLVIMPMLHLIDRPDDLHGVERRQGIGALASGASHAVVASLILHGSAVCAGARGALTSGSHLIRHGLFGFPIPPPTAAARPVAVTNRINLRGEQQRTGDQPITMPTAAAQPSTDVTTEPPIEPLAITAQPMANGTQALVGAIASESASEALGPGTGPGGNNDGRTRGDGNGPGDGIGDGVRSVGPGVTTPIVIQQVKPQYTADAMRAKVQGSVWLECIVLPDGTVGDVRVTRSLDPMFGLDQQAIDAAKQWRFKPGMANGKPVAVAITIELTFTLR